MLITSVVTGPFFNNTYLVLNEKTKEGILIDPSFYPVVINEKLITAHHADISTILLTHGHVDHIAGLTWMRKMYPKAKTYMDKKDEELLGDPNTNMSCVFPTPITADDPDYFIKPGDTLHFAGAEFQVIDTSGHTQGGVSFYMPKEGVVFSGDSLFRDYIGRTDLPGGDTRQLIHNIRANLMTLPPDTIVYPGHGDPTTIQREQKYNPFMQGDYDL